MEVTGSGRHYRIPRKRPRSTVLQQSAAALVRKGAALVRKGLVGKGLVPKTVLPEFGPFPNLR